MDDLLAAGLVVFLTGASLFALGTLGPLVLGGLMILAALVFEESPKRDDDDDEPTEKTNCPDCGARNPATRDECYYCDATL
ncbi:hypothetical protein ACFPYI_00170 [Halomarina salina]|uniref:Zinc ribbon domain-containing protein n=1 Tax=Halomarina salina TaxID=1872699 RepID=A0ABD5RHE6_9EURY|nr:hypothetical protein [Halomarina salina]